ncbi:hypothetical protein Y032_0223g2657 [Ancylostoma ceylanicum]|uniref:Peptidase S1 domain-containing protein n=1 Tax=Ancylostoma ceylanicum TaxID=53326 RepID=A0A016SHE8_9BILA|nr:hypothetical protein Y032_0223g2657 [Ancylostoma ceylanicum]
MVRSGPSMGKRLQPSPGVLCKGYGDHLAAAQLWKGHLGATKHEVAENGSIDNKCSDSPPASLALARFAGLRKAARNHITYNNDLNNWSIYIGSTCRHPEYCLVPREISGFVYLTGYYPCLQSNDLAIIHLKNEVSEVDGVPICTAERDEATKDLLHTAGTGYNRKSLPFSHSW